MASTSVGSHAIVLEVLNQHNYTDWSSQVETYLLAKDLWDVVKQRPPPVKARNKAWKKKNARALHAIKISCGTEMFSFIRARETANSAWNALRDNEFKTYKLEKEDTKCTDLHRAVTAAMKGEVDTVNNLLSSMIGAGAEPESQVPPDLNFWIRQIDVEQLKSKDSKNRTALDIVIVASSAKTQARSIQIARAMVEKNREIVTISSMPWNYIPVVRACSRNKWEMARYLLTLTPAEALDGRQGAQLISMCIRRPEGLGMIDHMFEKIMVKENNR